MDTYTSSPEIYKEKLRKDRFLLRQKAFISGDVSQCKFRLTPTIDNTRSLSQIARDELIFETDIYIRGLVHTLHNNYSSPGYSQLPRKRNLLPDIEASVLKTYFNDDLSQWNNYLKMIQQEFGKAHPYGVCLYIREVGLPLPIPKDNSQNHSIRLSTRKEILQRIRARKKAEKKKR